VLPLLLRRIRAGAAPWSSLEDLPSASASCGGGGRAPQIQVSPDRIWRAHVSGRALCVVGGQRSALGAVTAVAAAADASGGGCGRRGAAATKADAEERKGLRPTRCWCRQRLQSGPLCLPEPGLATGGWQGLGAWLPWFSRPAVAVPGRLCLWPFRAVTAWSGWGGACCILSNGEVVCWGALPPLFFIVAVVPVPSQWWGWGVGGCLPVALRWGFGLRRTSSGRKAAEAVGAVKLLQPTCADWHGAHPGESLH
jgi:hypothetical protein